MQKISMERWAKTAAEQMKFARDREAVQKELRDHMLDRRLDFLEQGMDLEAAEAAAVEAMGDPVETGKLLNRVHSPVLGWLWLLSKWLLVAVTLLVFLVMVSNSFPISRWQGNAGEVFGWQEPCTCEMRFDVFPDFEPLPVETGMIIREGSYTMELDHGFYYVNPIADGGEQYLTLGFQVRGDHIWTVAPKALKDDLQAVDDLGYEYILKGSSLYQVQIADVGLPVWMVHIHVFVPYDGPLQQREWFRFSVPDTDFAFTVHTDGEVSPWG